MAAGGMPLFWIVNAMLTVLDPTSILSAKIGKAVLCVCREITVIDTMHGRGMHVLAS